MTDTAPTEPTQEQLDAFNAAVQGHIDARAKEGITLSWADAATQFGNLLGNIANNPESVEQQFQLEQRVTEIERRLNVAGIG